MLVIFQTVLLMNFLPIRRKFSKKFGEYEVPLLGLKTSHVALFYV